VTLAIGDYHLRYWQQFCQASWQAFAQKYGLDVIVLRDPLDRSPRATGRSPAWQKCLVLSQDFVARYEQLVLLDCDIVINAEAAPCITDQTPVEFVGGVIAGSQIHEDLRTVLLSRLRRAPLDYQRGTRYWQEDQESYYRHYGLTPLDTGIIQTGVLVASPQHHREVFAGVYKADYPVEHRNYEQVPLSHAILSSGQFHQIDTRFNHVFYESMLVHNPYLLNTQTPSYELMASYALQSELANSFWIAPVAIVVTSSLLGQDQLPDAFRGQSLTAWTTLDGGPVTQGWVASDREIRLHRLAARGGHILTAAEFSDFDLSFEWKIASRGNSGLKYRVRKYGEQTLGLEYQICDEPEGRPLSRKSASALYDLYEPAAERLLKPAGEWNAARIVVRGDRIEHWLNGALVVAATVGDEQWRRRIAESKFAHEERFGENRSGRIMLTDHGSDVAYRNFEFKRLTIAP
jgi:hypothetical protein